MFHLKEKFNRQTRAVLSSAVGGILLILFWIFINGARNVSHTSPPQIAETTISTPPPAQNTGTYKDGTYRATSQTPWGDYTISIDVKNGRWNKVNTITAPDSPPSQYAAPLLAAQALQSQSANIDGISGATYVSQAFADDLTQIIQQSQN